MRRIAGLVACLSITGLARPADGTWPRYGGPTADFRTPATPPDTLAESAVVWRVPAGLGESGVIGDGTRLYTMIGERDKDDLTKGTERVVALDPKTGKTLWEHKYAVAGLPKGDTPVKGGKSGPQASPCAGDGRVFAIGYTGRVSALDAATGKDLWSKELIADWGGESPEFGFASSPILAGKRLLIPVGGKKTALIAVDPADGSEAWRAPADRASCATPQVATLCGREQVVHLSRNKLSGYSLTDGKELWSFKLPLQGLTNVPSPLVLSGDRVLISGQGVKGMRLLTVTRDGEKWAVAEAWKADPQFFYCDWGVVGDVLYGYGGSAFVAIGLKEGEVLWSDKNWKDANWLSAGGVPLILRGDGRLARCKFTDAGVVEVSGFAVTPARTWTPPSVVGQTLYVRNGKEIVAVSLAGK